MAKGLTLEVVGLNDVIKKISAVSQAKRQLIGNEIKATAFDIVDDAQSNISGLRATTSGNAVDLNALRGSIRVGTVTEYSAEAVVGVWYAAYVEFGTGSYAARYLSSQPSEIQAYAKTFFVNGKGTMPARPFFFPAVYKNYNELVKRLAAILNK
jgi:HK97 gp10 family phage protein